MSQRRKRFRRNCLYIAGSVVAITLFSFFLLRVAQLQAVQNSQPAAQEAGIGK